MKKQLKQSLVKQNMPPLHNASKDELDIIGVLLKCGQGHLFQDWPPVGESTVDKKRFLQQMLTLESQIPGGLIGYVSRAKKLLEDSRIGVNPYEGYIPKVPVGATLETNSPNGLAEFERFENIGLEHVADACFVIVAGGLGERLGYNGIKLALPSDICSDMCFLDLYCQSILSLQTKARSLKGCSSIVIPFVIMTSGDTDEKTRSLLEHNNDFGMANNQIRIIKQEKVPALNNNNAEFILEKNDPFSILTKPHGHGDVHTLIYQNGFSSDWKLQGKKWILFFQDTNGLVFRALPAALGVSVEKKLVVNSLTVPRKPGEAVGAICRLESDSKPSMTINVEYNQLDSLMKASGMKDTIGETGFSPFPGNINVLIFDAQSYALEMEKSKGKISEFVNPKYKDKEKTVFKKPTRLECMMQDYPKCLEPDKAVGFTQCDRWTSFSATKNNVKDAVTKFKKTGYGECAASGEADIFWAHRNSLKIAGANIDVDGKEVIVEGVPVKRGACVILSPSFACILADVKQKIKGTVKISNTSTLILHGNSILINNLELDGALVVHVGPKAHLTIDAVVKNAGWAFREINVNDMNIEEKYRIRGYTIQKTEQKIIDLSKESGNWLLTNSNTGKIKLAKQSSDLIIEGIHYSPLYMSKESVLHARSYQPTEKDIFVVSFPHGGSTWMTQIVHEMMIQGKYLSDNHNINDILTWIEAKEEKKSHNSSGLLTNDVRIIKTHLPLRHHPYSSKAKYIVVVRDPGNCLLSSCNFNPSIRNIFCSSSGPNGGWCKHVAGWWSLREKPNVLVIFYEDLLLDFEDGSCEFSTFKDIAAFLQIHDLTSKNWETITSHSLKYIEANPSFFSKNKNESSNDTLNNLNECQVFYDNCIERLKNMGADKFPFYRAHKYEEKIIPRVKKEPLLRTVAFSDLILSTVCAYAASQQAKSDIPSSIGFSMISIAASLGVIRFGFTRKVIKIHKLASSIAGTAIPIILFSIYRNKPSNISKAPNFLKYTVSGVIMLMLSLRSISRKGFIFGCRKENIFHYCFAVALFLFLKALQVKASISG